MVLLCTCEIRAEITKLEAEQEEVLKDLRLIESRSNQNKDDRNCEGLGELGREKRNVNLHTYKIISGMLALEIFVLEISFANHSQAHNNAEYGFVC